jgi:hypothetical protein
VGRVVVRGALGVLAAANLWWGLWAITAPRGFFDKFPGWGHRWTAAYPPYNEHLVNDLGATFLTLGVLLAVATALNDRRVTTVVLVGVLLFNSLHLAFHATRHGMLTGFDLGASLTILAAGVAVPIALPIAVRRQGPGGGAEAPR